jgi:hypothetical protein
MKIRRGRDRSNPVAHVPSSEPALRSCRARDVTQAVRARYFRSFFSSTL